MAATSGTQNLDLIGGRVAEAFSDVAMRLHLEPFAFRFFQAVWLLERMQPGAVPVGEFGPHKREACHFGSHASLSFPASEIQRIDWEQFPPKVMVNFMGMQGLSGVLPYVYTELINERERAGDYSLSHFLDVLNNRFAALFYRAWRRYRFAHDPRRVRTSLLSLVGLGTERLENRLSVPDDGLLFYTGLLGLQPRSAAALEQIVSDYFDVPAEVEQFVGAWYALGDDSTCTFDDLEDPSEQLGLGTVVGDAVWDQQSQVRVRIGPLPRARYEEFLPGRPAHRRLADLTRLFARDQIDFEVQLVLRREDVPGCKLEEPETLQLGWTTWMKTRPEFPRHADDAILNLRPVQ